MARPSPPSWRRWSFAPSPAGWAEGAPTGGPGLTRPRPAPAPTPQAVAEAIAIDPTAYTCIRDHETLDAWIARARAAGVIAFDTETDSLSSSDAGLCGVSIAITPGEAAYIPVGHCKAAPSEATGLDFGEPDGADAKDEEDWRQLDCGEALAKLKPLLEDPAVLKVAQNAKYDMAVLSRYGIEVGPIEDTMLISYVLEGGLHGHGMDELSQLHLGHTPIPFKQVAGDRQIPEELRPGRNPPRHLLRRRGRGRDAAPLQRPQTPPPRRGPTHRL